MAAGRDAHCVLLGFSGKCRSGKNATAECAAAWFRARGWDVNFAAFADPLRRVLEVLTGVPPAETYSAADKARALPSPWGMTVGRALQTLATDAIRNNFHSDAWVIAALQAHDMAALRGPHTTPVVWIFTDVRFPNEARAIRERGGAVVRVERINRNVSAETRDLGHISETALDGYPHFAARIDNNRDIAALDERVGEVLAGLYD